MEMVNTDLGLQLCTLTVAKFDSPLYWQLFGSHFSIVPTTWSPSND